MTLSQKFTQQALCQFLWFDRFRGRGGPVFGGDYNACGVGQGGSGGGGCGGRNMAGRGGSRNHGQSSGWAGSERRGQNCGFGNSGGKKIGVKATCFDTITFLGALLSLL